MLSRPVPFSHARADSVSGDLSAHRSVPAIPAVLAALVALVLALGLLAFAGTPQASASPAATRTSSPSATQARAAGYHPAEGASFNNPVGGAKVERRLLQKITRAINHAPRKSTIRIAIFSFADKKVGDALARAYRRGVHIKLIMADTHTYGQMRRMKKILGTDRSKISFAYQCKDSCRSTAGQMHAKFFSFRRSGTARFVTMVGSVNLTRHNATHQWNDLYTVADHKVWTTYNRWFSQLKADRPQADPYVEAKAGASRIDFTPIDLRRHKDPVLQAMRRVSCGKSPEVDISSYAWNGMRGRDIAKRVAVMKRNGCKVRVILGQGAGSAVRSILKNNHVTMKRSSHKGVSTHQKMMVVRGGVDGAKTGRVWTGSHNWSSRSAARDDLFVEIADQDVVEDYTWGFGLQWRKG